MAEWEKMLDEDIASEWVKYHLKNSKVYINNCYKNYLKYFKKPKAKNPASDNDFLNYLVGEIATNDMVGDMIYNRTY